MTLPIPISRCRVRTLHRMPAFVFALLWAVVATVTVPPAVRAAEPPLPTADSVPDPPVKPAVPANDPAVQARLPGCAMWTDRCVTCTNEAGRISCSNIGIACQPQAVECVRSEQAEEKKEEDGSKKQEN
jgi:hypothetical protein